MSCILNKQACYCKYISISEKKTYHSCTFHSTSLQAVVFFTHSWRRRPLEHRRDLAMSGGGVFFYPLSASDKPHVHGSTYILKHFIYMLNMKRIYIIQLNMKSIYMLNS